MRNKDGGGVQSAEAIKKMPDWVLAMVVTARENFRRHGHLTAAVMLHTANPDQLEVIGISAKNEEEKDLIVAWLKSRIEEDHVDSLLLIMESWIATKIEGDDRPARERPDRTEGVVFTYQDAYVEASCVLKIEERAGVRGLFGAPVFVLLTDSGGRFSGLIARKREEAIH